MTLFHSMVRPILAKGRGVGGVLAAAVALTVGPVRSLPAAVTFDWATVGDPGNPADTLVMDKGPAAEFTTGYGSVDYAYRISKYGVTNSQYVSFLNTVDPAGTNALNLWDRNMSEHIVGGVGPQPATTGGIDLLLGAAEGSRYAVKAGQEQFPAVWVRWSSAARFVNWFAGGQGVAGTESGVYDMSVLTSGFSTPPTRAADATIFLASENEYYKAAYYDPSKNDGAGGYWQYGTRSDVAPASVPPPGGTNAANIGQGQGVGGTAETLATTGAAYDATQNYLTDVGAYSSATSAYGLYDIEGPVYNWTEGTRSVFGNELPIIRGGSWRYGEGYSGAAYRNSYSGANVAGYASIGFRIAGLPEAPPAGVVIDVASGTVTQAQAGYPSITTADSVTKTGAGTLVFDAVNSYAGPTVVSAGTLRVASNTGLPATALTVEAGGTLALPQDARVSLGVARLSLADGAGGGRVDLGAGQLTVAAGGISAADLRADIIAGRNGGGWNGSSGLTSSAAAASGGTRAVGYVVAGDGTAQASFAAPGDTNLNGTVDVFDLVGINSGGKYGAGTAAVWSEGDFNYDGVTNVFDLVGINTAGAYGRGNYFPASPAVAGLNAVPEPTAWGAVGAGLAALAALLRRRANRGSLK
jgi:formylglycine-generating enzyme